MKKIYIIIALLMMGMIAEAQTSIWNGSRRLWTNGEGTESSPYLIESAEHLAFLSYIVNKGINTKGLYFEMTTDIDLNGSEDLPWFPIGMGNRWYSDDGCDRTIDPSYNAINVFEGHFDGGGHSIYNLYVEGLDYAGLFGYVSNGYNEGTSIKNVTIENGYVNGAYSGGIVGGCQGTVFITNCNNNAEINGTIVAGGIVGFGSKAIRNCYNTGHITSTSKAGGIAGMQAKAITECFNAGDITIEGELAGGIIGLFSSGIITIKNCYNTGDLSGQATNGMGGIAGYISGSYSEVLNCYNVGSLTNEGGTMGGLYGNGNPNCVSSNVYYLNTCGGWGQGTGKTAEEMRDPDFVNTLNLNTDVWGFDENNTNDGYPILTGTLMATDDYATNMMSLYPNPALGSFTVEGTGLLTIYNVLGQKIMEQSVETQTHISLPEGIYLVKLTVDNNSTTKKVVVY